MLPFKYDLAMMVRSLKEVNDMLPEDQKDKYLEDFNMYDLNAYDPSTDGANLVKRLISKPIKAILSSDREGGEPKQISDLKAIAAKVIPQIRELDKEFLTSRKSGMILDKYPEDEQYRRESIRRMIYKNPNLVVGFALTTERWLNGDKELQRNGFSQDQKKNWYLGETKIGKGRKKKYRKGGSDKNGYTNISLLDFIRRVRDEGLGSMTYSDVMVNKSLLKELKTLATNSGYNLILPVNKSYATTTSAYSSYIKKRK
jgi:hypothetical protein